MGRIIVSLLLTTLGVTCFGIAWPQDKAEGKKIYTTYCIGCHGEKGKGDGAAASALTVKPADLSDGAVMNQLADSFLTEIVAKGGGAVGKSPMMPGLGSQFTATQMRDLVGYIRSLAEPPYQPRQ